MTAEEFFTKAFRIAPLTKMPVGVRCARIDIPNGDFEVAERVLRRAHPSVDKPYWKIDCGYLVVVTEPDHEALRLAMREVYPE